MEHKQKNEIDVSAGLVAGAGLSASIVRKTHYKVEAFDKDGNLKWVEEFDNLVVTAGLNDSLDKHFKGSSYTAAWFVGLASSSPTFAAGDTLASHGGWTEITAYTGNRKALTLGTVSAGSVDNSASKASFTMTGSATVGGAFVGTVATGTSGILYGGGAFGTNRSLVTDDVLNVTVTLTAAAA